VITLAGCETTNPKATLKVDTPFSSLKPKRDLSPPLVHAIQLLKEEKYSEASQFINQALQSQPKNPFFHILNGLTYEKLAERGDATGLELAAIGYQNAINIDSSNVFAITQLAKLKYREKHYDEAQEHFANALLIKPNDPDLLHELAAASYYAYDIKTALSAIDRAGKLKPDDPLIHRSATLIHAALGDFNTAQKHFNIFQEKMGNDPAVTQVASRLNDWQHLYKSGRIKLASATSNPSEPNPGGPSSSGSSPVIPPSPSEAGDSSSPDGGGDDSSGGDGDSDSSGANPATTSEAKKVLSMPFETKGAPGQQGPQIVVDCYLLRITEDAQTSKGNNILENLAVTLNPGGLTTFQGKLSGSGVSSLDNKNITPDNIVFSPDTGFKSNQIPLTGSAASAFTPTTSTINLNNKGSLSGNIFAAGITWAGLTYSLNIANAIDSRTEVVSRPSLMTFLKKQSVFFSGDELVIGLSGQFGGTLTKYPVGVTLLVTPESLEGDLLTLNITIEQSLLTSPNPNLQQTVDVAKTRTDTFVKVHLGETLMLGGIYDRVEIASKNGFPGLQDVPLLQYFFSNETTQSVRRSIVFMLTPRSPDAVKSAVNRAMSRGAVQPHLNELVSRNPSWFSTHANMITIFRYLSKDPVIYYEFRSGDILPPSWGWEPPMDNKLQQLAAFLYY
jgi:Flp pilus assembly protein TadD